MSQIKMKEVLKNVLNNVHISNFKYVQDTSALKYILNKMHFLSPTVDSSSKHARLPTMQISTTDLQRIKAAEGNHHQEFEKKIFSTATTLSMFIGPHNARDGSRVLILSECNVCLL